MPSTFSHRTRCSALFRVGRHRPVRQHADVALCRESRVHRCHRGGRVRRSVVGEVGLRGSTTAIARRKYRAPRGACGAFCAYGRFYAGAQLQRIGLLFGSYAENPKYCVLISLVLGIMAFPKFDKHHEL